MRRLQFLFKTIWCDIFICFYQIPPREIRSPSRINDVGYFYLLLITMTFCNNIMEHNISALFSSCHCWSLAVPCSDELPSDNSFAVHCWKGETIVGSVPDSTFGPCPPDGFWTSLYNNNWAEENYVKETRECKGFQKILKSPSTASRVSNICLCQSNLVTDKCCFFQ